MRANRNLLLEKVIYGGDLMDYSYITVKNKILEPCELEKHFLIA